MSYEQRAPIPRRVALRILVGSTLALPLGACTTGTDRRQPQPQIPPPPTVTSREQKPTPVVPEPSPTSTIEKYHSTETIIRHGDPDKPYIYYTVDDCNNPELVEGFLDAARDNGVRITFFPNGSIIEQRPDLLRRMVKEGHGVGNHTFAHYGFAEKSNEEYLNDIRRQTDAVRKVLGDDYDEYFFRAPYGEFGPREGSTLEKLIREKLGHRYRLAGWNIDSRGWDMKNMSQEAAFDQLAENTINSPAWGPGAIILTHANISARHDLAFFPKIIKKAREDGFQFISMHEGIA